MPRGAPKWKTNFENHCKSLDLEDLLDEVFKHHDPNFRTIANQELVRRLIKAGVLQVTDW